MNEQPSKPAAPPSIFSILGPYRGMIALLATLTITANALTLWLPKIISHAIEGYAKRTLQLNDVAWQFGLVGAGVFIFTLLQTITQTYAAEAVARDLRSSLAAKISRQGYASIQAISPSRLLTNLTSDMDSVKTFVAQAISSLISSVFLILGASVLLLLTNWKLALAVLLIVPLIGIFFFLTLRQAQALFLSFRAIIDRLNQVINESILGAAIVRVLNAGKTEHAKFETVNTESKNVGLQIVSIFARLIPAITFIASLASVVILALGGHYLINGTLSLGDFTSFTSYLSILIFPIIVIGFISNLIAQANASYGRIAEVLATPEAAASGTLVAELTGQLSVSELTMRYGEKYALKHVSFSVAARSKTAIIGPTAAGKTQLLYALTGLTVPTSGTVSYDGHQLDEYESESLHRQIGFVFQDSIIFNMSVRENIAFNTSVSDAGLEKAITTAELDDFLGTLPDGLDTVISERGTSLSGGQKQRLMLARALALEPKILMLDDFTARVDAATEAKILANLAANYPELTLISVTQKISSVEAYEQIIVLMEGEVLAVGTHQELLKTSPDYVQIYTSQQSTNAYELHPE